MITPTMREFVVLFLLSEKELEALRKRVFKILVFEGEREKSTFIFVYVCVRERERVKVLTLRGRLKKSMF